MGLGKPTFSDDPGDVDEPRHGGNSKAVTIVFALLLVLGAAAFMYFYDDKPDPSQNVFKEFTFEAAEVQEARADEPEGLAQLQRLVLSPDPSIANQAVFKLTLSGRDGWLALFAQLPDASAEVRAYVQNTMLGEGRFASAAEAIESGSAMARDGAYLVLETSTLDVFNAQDPSTYQRDEDAMYKALLTRIHTEDVKEAEAVLKLMKRYHTNTPYALGLMLEHESPIVRAAGVHSFMSFMSDSRPESVERVKELQSDPDPRVRKEVAEVLKSYRQPRTNIRPGMPPPVAPKEPH